MSTIIDSLTGGPRQRQYLYDRCTGKSKWGEHEEKPACPMCYVPMPAYWCSPVLEQNPVCEFFGRVGLLDADYALRRKIIAVGFFANVAAFVLTFYACFAMSMHDAQLLRAASFTEGILKANGLPTTIYTHIGLRAVAVTDTNDIFEPRILSFDEWCDRFQYSLEDFDPDVKSQCGGCQSQSTGLVSSIIMSLVMLIPSINTDITRSFKNYDVNCQKFFGAIVGLFSAFSSIYTFLLYNGKCSASFYEGFAPFKIPADSEYRSQFVESHPELAVALAETNPGEGTILIEMEWGPGPGLIAIYVSLALKIVDIVVNFLIPAPSITRDRAEQMEYERLNGKKENIVSAVTGEGEDNDQERGDLATTPLGLGNDSYGTADAPMVGDAVEVRELAPPT